MCKTGALPVRATDPSSRRGRDRTYTGRFRRSMPIPLGDTPTFGSPGRSCSRKRLQRRNLQPLVCKTLALPLSYRTLERVMGFVGFAFPQGTHALRLASSDATATSHPHWLGRKTRLELVSPGWKPGMLATAPLSQMGLVTGVEPATDCLQNSCSTVEPHQLVGSGAGI